VKSDKEHSYERVPKLVENHVMESTSANRQNPLPQQKPDIIIHDNVEGTSMSIGVAVSGDENVIKKGAERILDPLRWDQYVVLKSR